MERGYNLVNGNSNNTSRDTVRVETNRAIKKVMDVIERYTDYENLEEIKKDIVRDTILNQINKVSRVATTKNTIVFNNQE